MLHLVVLEFVSYYGHRSTGIDGDRRAVCERDGSPRACLPLHYDAAALPALTASRVRAGRAR
jgi:hypothetical protein